MNAHLVFTYGYPSSGKTTYSRWVMDHWDSIGERYVYISADKIREELYGSQDIYGDPETIYKVILDRMISAMDRSENVLYDACNLYLSYRMDYMRYLNKYDNYYKSVLRVTTDKDTCIRLHKDRGRSFSIERLSHYFDIDEPPRLSEGWDEIWDLSLTPDNKRFYIASPFFGEEERQRVYDIAEFFRKRGDCVFLPCEHKVENAWDLPNYEWGMKVFETDIKAIERCDYMVSLSYGRKGSAGTAWETGYAYGIGKKVVVVEMPGVDLMSIMMSNGCGSVLRSVDELYSYDFEKFEMRIDQKMEQK